MLHMAELLVHSPDVPPAARLALASGIAEPADQAQRRTHLVEAARILHFDSGLDCEDACELVGLGDDYDCTSS